jgi:hypothetical protein
MPAMVMSRRATLAAYDSSGLEEVHHERGSTDVGRSASLILRGPYLRGIVKEHGDVE